MTSRNGLKYRTKHSNSVFTFLQITIFTLLSCLLLSTKLGETRHIGRLIVRISQGELIVQDSSINSDKGNNSSNQEQLDKIAKTLEEKHQIPSSITKAIAYLESGRNLKGKIGEDNFWGVKAVSDNNKISKMTTEELKGVLVYQNEDFCYKGCIDIYKNTVLNLWEENGYDMESIKSNPYDAIPGLYKYASDSQWVSKIQSILKTHFPNTRRKMPQSPEV